jgi:hypothetical protein
VPLLVIVHLNKLVLAALYDVDVRLPNGRRKTVPLLVICIEYRVMLLRHGSALTFKYHNRRLEIVLS